MCLLRSHSPSFQSCSIRPAPICPSGHGRWGGPSTQTWIDKTEFRPSMTMRCRRTFAACWQCGETVLRTETIVAGRPHDLITIPDQDQVMDTWSFRIRREQDAPDIAQGYVRATNVVKALSLIGHQDAILNKRPAERTWPGSPDEDIHFSNRAGLP